MSVLARRLGVVTLAPMIAILCACSAGSGTVTIGNGTDPTLVSNIATLIGVTLSDGDDTRRQTANPTVTAWNSSVTEWTYDVSSTVSTITVTPAPSDNTAQVRVISGDVNALLPAGVTSPDISLAATAPTTITLAVIAANGTTKTYTLTVNHLAVSDSTLNRLLLSGAVLSPAFNPNTTAYATTVPFAVSTLTVKPTPRDGAATVTVNNQPLDNGAITLTLAVGAANIFTIRVTAVDDSVQDYTLTVTREGSGRLSSLGIACVGGSTCGTALSPPFDSDTGDYTSEQNFDVLSIQLLPQTEDATATIAVNGQPVAINQPSQAITLNPGPNPAILIEVSHYSSTTSNHLATQTYRVTPTRDPPPALDPQAIIRVPNSSSQAFAQSMAFAGDTIAVGAYAESTTATGSGAVYIFTRDGSGAWSQQAKLKASAPGLGDNFGFSVALAADGNTLAVGAYGEDYATNGVSTPPTSSCPILTSACALDSGAAYIFTRDGSGVWSLQAYIKASQTFGNDNFGRSVALAADGNTLVVGAPNQSSNATGIGGTQTNDCGELGSTQCASQSGAAYVFARSGGTWSQQAYVKAINTGEFDRFGDSVALAEDGNLLAVGATNESSNGTGVDDLGALNDNTANASGAVYTYTRSGVTWTPQSYIKASNTEAGDVFGISIALSGDTLAVGASSEGSGATGINGSQTNGPCEVGGGSCFSSGAAYVFTLSSGVWSQQAYIKASNTGAGDWFGASVALSGDLLAVGAQKEASNGTGVDNNSAQADDSALNSGAAYTFTRDSGGVWSQQAYIKPAVSASSLFFGYCTAVSAGSVAVCAPFEKDVPSNATGSVYVFIPSSSP